MSQGSHMLTLTLRHHFQLALVEEVANRRSNTNILMNIKAGISLSVWTQTVNTLTHLRPNIQLRTHHKPPHSFTFQHWLSKSTNWVIHVKLSWRWTCSSTCHILRLRPTIWALEHIMMAEHSLEALSFYCSVSEASCWASCWLGSTYSWLKVTESAPSVNL